MAINAANRVMRIRLHFNDVSVPNQDGESDLIILDVFSRNRDLPYYGYYELHEDMSTAFLDIGFNTPTTQRRSVLQTHQLFTLLRISNMDSTHFRIRTGSGGRLYRILFDFDGSRDFYDNVLRFNVRGYINRTL